MFTLTVSQLNKYVKAVLEEDKKLADLYISGEISNFTNHYRSGHFYFSLKDEKSSIKAVMFESHASKLPFEPRNGMMVIVRASLGVYERDGAYQLYVSDIQPDGAGSLALAFEQLKEKLSKEGLFDEKYKKPLPPLPGKIGVVTSETGAAFKDILNVISRRYPLAALILSPASVQGEGAEEELVRALRALDSRCDVIIIGRGGGSAEDLRCFNGEALARAVFMAETPVISAVGHETDYTICDFVADVRAPTPSAAAELAAVSADSLRKEITAKNEYFTRRALGMLKSARQAMDGLSSRPALRYPMFFAEKKQKELDSLSEKMYNNKNSLIAAMERRLSGRAALLGSLSPLRVLERGYAAVLKEEGSPARGAGELSAGDTISVLMRDGSVKATVTEVQKARTEAAFHHITNDIGG